MSSEHPEVKKDWGSLTEGIKRGHGRACTKRERGRIPQLVSSITAMWVSARDSICIKLIIISDALSTQTSLNRFSNAALDTSPTAVNPFRICGNPAAKHSTPFQKQRHVVQMIWTAQITVEKKQEQNSSKRSRIAQTQKELNTLELPLS